ncbi:ubiquitin-protein ligase UBE3B, partial [Aphelenchoides avenae]
KASHLIAELIRRVPAVLGACDLDRVAGVRSTTALVDFLHLYTAADDWTLVRTNKPILQIFQALCAKNIGPLAEAEAHANMAKCLQSGLKRSKPAFTSETTNAFFAVFMRTLQNTQFNNASVDQFIKQILAVPAIILHLSQANLQELKSSRVFEKVVARLTQHQRNIADLSHIDSLHLLANFVHLSYLEQEALVEHLLDWTATINVLLGRCQSFDGGKRKNNWHHPILGWTNERIDDGTQGVAGRVMLQLSYLWSTRMVTCLFGKVLGSCEQRPQRSSSSRKRKPSSETERLPVEMVQKLLKKLSVREQTVSTTTIPPVSLTAVVCQLYQLALLTFPNSHIDILSGLCRDDTILLQLWNFVNEDNTAGLNNYLSFLSVDPTVTLPHFAPLHLFADIACSLISILDEKEMYENGTPFKLAQLCEMAKFANTFCFRVIWEKSMVLCEHRLNALFQSIYQLCTILYNRDCRRPFTNKPNFWIVNDVKASVIVAEFEKHTTRAQMLMQKMPHVVPLRERMLLFRKLVQQDKDSIDLPGTVITVERTRIVEDGYRQLANLSSQALRATIRVKFINQQGLDEAGIDQDGVFKEFLEVTIKKVFDPELNLFK